jgi:2-amino-4-hydroxy-6-hydroxymethyldihydropteridine diphosphokinase/dihydropteroate synthase
MSILNLTPDSFSDGGVHQTQNDEYLHNTISRMFEQGADIIDIGGESTRPGSHPLPQSEELRRILPAVRVACKLRKPHQAISIDTYHADVADQALRVGADIINDVSAGTLDPDLLPTVARHGCAVVLMHMRGTPQTMTESRFGDYGNDIIATIGAELAARVHAAEAAGIRRWRILLDPGFGFAKNAAQNLELLRRLPELRSFPGLGGLPWVIGLSRKRFVRKLLGSLEKQLDAVGEIRPETIGSFGALMAAVHGGADVVRVHDTGASKGLALIGDKVWRH